MLANSHKLALESPDHVKTENVAGVLSYACVCNNLYACEFMPYHLVHEYHDCEFIKTAFN
jgi:hypothetical protein